MIRLAICDDDNENMSYMKEKINEAFIKSGYNDEIIYNLFNTGEELVNAHIANELDIVFMDIELENKSIWFDVARILCRQNKNIAIIYIIAMFLFCADKIKTLQLYICPITTIMSLRVLYADLWGL